MEERVRLPLRAAWILSRGASVAVGGFLLVALLLRVRIGGPDASIWLLDLRFLPSLVSVFFVLLMVASLLAYGLQLWAKRLRLLTAGACGLCASVAVANGVAVRALHGEGRISLGAPVPLSLLLALVLVGVGVMAFTQPTCMPSRHIAKRVAQRVCIVACAFAFAVLGSVSQMMLFGKTDYRRPAEITVVFGSRVYADGRLSDALEDRVRTACELYEEGLTKRILMSGGPGDGAIDEAEAMRRFALDRGIPDSAILLDQGGVNTAATIESTAALTASTPGVDVLLVSHSYHLPRVKLESDRAGLNAFTVPAKESYLLTKMPWFMAREVAAQWVYLVRPLF